MAVAFGLSCIWFSLGIVRRHCRKRLRPKSSRERSQGDSDHQRMMKRLAGGVEAQKQNKLAKHWESRQEWIDNLPLNPTCHHEDAFDACKMEPIYNQEPAYACDGKIVDWKKHK